MGKLRILGIKIAIWVVLVLVIVIAGAPLIYTLKSNSSGVIVPLVKKNIHEELSNNTYESDVTIIGSGGGNGELPGVETGEFTGTGNGKEVALLGGWLAIYDDSTVAGKGREIFVYDGAVKRPPGFTDSKFHSEERMSHINPWYKGSQQVITMANGNLINETNRTWVAYGPEVMNPGILKTGKTIGAGDMFYGTYVDVVLIKDGVKYYMPTVIGECKMHTWDTGIVQTSISCQSPHEFVPGHVDGSIVEFIGKASLNGVFNGYRIYSLIVYDGIGG